MIVKTIKTEKILLKKQDIFKILNKYIKKLNEASILAITSKIISICEGRFINSNKVNKEDLIEQQSEYYLPPEESKYNITLTIKNNLLIPTAGIDESNTHDHFVLWPKNPQDKANKIREYFQKKFNLKKFGVIITDSKTTPLRWGVTGVAIAHSGFSALNNYIGKPDIFKRKLKVTKVNVMDGLAVSSVLVMGEGNEQTPIAIIENLPFVKFQKRNPTKKELKELHISINDDLYTPLLKGVNWKKGKNQK